MLDRRFFDSLDETSSFELWLRVTRRLFSDRLLDELEEDDEDSLDDRRAARAAWYRLKASFRARNSFRSKDDRRLSTELFDDFSDEDEDRVAEESELDDRESKLLRRKPLRPNRYRLSSLSSSSSSSLSNRDRLNEPRAIRPHRFTGPLPPRTMTTTLSLQPVREASASQGACRCGLRGAKDPTAKSSSSSSSPLLPAAVEEPVEAEEPEFDEVSV